MATGSMVHLVSVHHAFHARVIAARLGSDGILTELRGMVEGPYPVSGEIRVYVGPDDLPVARELLLADEVESCFDQTEDNPMRPGGRGRGGSGVRWLALAAVVLVVVSGLLRLG